MSQSHDNDRSSPEELTLILRAAGGGSTTAQSDLLRHVYGKLRQMAQRRMHGERESHTLCATALVHEAFLRLFPQSGNTASWATVDRAAFFRAAATAMRRILIDHARARAAVKRGAADGGARGIDLDLLAAAENADPTDILALDEALSRLEEVDGRAAEIVRLRFYAGQDFESVAKLMDIGVRTAKRDWEFARAWLQQEIDGKSNQSNQSNPGKRQDG